MSEAAYFLESWPPIFYFFWLFLLHSMLDPDPKSGFGSRPGSGSVKTKSPGSCGSGSGSETLGSATLPAASSDKVESEDFEGRQMQQC
jgi:hypothetical protein